MAEPMKNAGISDETAVVSEQFVITEDMKPINVGLLGVGTVGGGTFAVLRRNQEEIARRLSLSAKTVNTHKTRLFDKLGIRDSIALARMATRCGLADPAHAF